MPCEKLAFGTDQARFELRLAAPKLQCLLCCFLPEVDMSRDAARMRAHPKPLNSGAFLDGVWVRNTFG